MNPKDARHALARCEAQLKPLIVRYEATKHLRDQFLLDDSSMGQQCLSIVEYGVANRDGGIPHILAREGLDESFPGLVHLQRKIDELKERQTALLGEQATEADYIAWREQAKREADIIAPQIQEVTDLSAQLDRLLTMAAPIAIEIALKIANLRTVV